MESFLKETGPGPYNRGVEDAESFFTARPKTSAGTRRNIFPASTDISNQMQFRYEGGAWKSDLTSLFQKSNVAMKDAAKQAGLDENTFLFTILESISGKKVAEDIWTPPN